MVSTPQHGRFWGVYHAIGVGPGAAAADHRAWAVGAVMTDRLERGGDVDVVV